jgi:DnaJ family protein C protein 7
VTRYHPDKQAGKPEAEKNEAEVKFKSLGEAYDCLSDPEKRARYDQGVDVEDIDNPHAGPGGMQHHGGGMHGIDPNIIFQMFMQQQMGGRGGGMHF